MTLPKSGTNRDSSFARRANLVEFMDRPDCSLTKLYRTLDQFRWINAWLSRYRYLLRRYVIWDMLAQPDREWRLVDLGAGGCDITVWLLRQAARRGLHLKATALERDPRIIAYAQAKYGDVDGLTIAVVDALDPSCWEPTDYVFANHFLHHLDNAEIVRLLQLVGGHTRRLFVLNDIRRSRMASGAYALAIGLLAHRSFALADGLMSIRRAFLPDELQSLLQDAHLDVESRIRTLPPYRVAVIGGPALSGPAGATDQYRVKFRESAETVGSRGTINRDSF
jgi:hypothetical protein